MSAAASATTEHAIVAEHWTLTGRVQGLGVRPRIACIADDLTLTGFVRNGGEGVEVVVEGRSEMIATFRERLVVELPDGVRLDKIVVTSIRPEHRRTFEILHSANSAVRAAQIPPDRAVCASCLAEVAEPNNRRRGYPFTCCATCGPRYSLIGAMPYDRGRTSMAGFTLCYVCQSEYETSSDRRYHAETIACPICGPGVSGTSDHSAVSDGDAAIATAAAALQRGAIVALRGVGGYQLIVDATNEGAVARLRTRKGRRAKPFAVLAATLDDARSLGFVDPLAERALVDAANSIVVVPRRDDSGLASGVCGAFPTVGLLLPTTPLHWQLSAQVGRPLVATSGNVEGEPLAYVPQHAQVALAGMADIWLHHDRPILQPIDDSVVRLIAGRQVTLRLARGLAPLPLELAADRPLLATGGHQSAAIALANGSQVVLGPHLGDLQGQATRERFVEHVAAMHALYGGEPAVVVHDLHPDYFTTRWACGQGKPTLAVQHHHAHAAAAMLEHGWLDREVLAFTWDGTGFGPDGTIWGGECLLASARSFQRVARCRPFALPGGEAAVHEPWRVAYVLVRDAVGRDAAQLVLPDDIPRTTSAQIETLAANKRLSPRTSSMGRLFDAVAYLTLGISHASFEGEPAMRLEAACDLTAQGTYALPLAEGDPLELDWRPMIAELCEDRAAHVPAGSLAMRFHRTLAMAVVALAGRYSHWPVVLAGGVFQNRVLVEAIVEHGHLASGRWGLPGVIPPGDGGLAAGQLAIGAAYLKSNGGR